MLSKMPFLRRNKSRVGGRGARLTPSVSTDSGCSEMQTSSSEPSDHHNQNMNGGEGACGGAIGLGAHSLLNSMFPSGSWQEMEMEMEMVSVETFIEYVKKKDLPRIKLALRDSHFHIDRRDEDGRTPLHHALVHGVVEGDLDTTQQLIDFGCDVNIKDETPHRESPIHVALRLGSLEAVKMLLNSASFQVIKCDSFQRSKMLPEAAVMADIHTPNLSLTQDSDCTLTKRRSFADQYLLFVRQNTRDYIENNFPPGRESIRDMIIIQDECVPPLSDILHRIDYAQLSSLYIADCRLHVKDLDVFDRLCLHTLVLSHTHLRRLPKSIFEMDSLQILKVDNNRLEEIPVEIGNLTNLQSFNCDSQKPRLRMLPLQSLTQLQNLEVLSFSNNRIDNISWVVALPGLRTLYCDRNRITRLPNQLVSLHNLLVLNVSHNRIEYIPHCFVELIKRLYKFEYFNLTLRPKHIRNDRQQLLSYLELENFLLQTHGRRAVRDVTVGIVGESHAGKSALVDALKSDKHLSKSEQKPESTFDLHQFEMTGGDSGCFITTIVFANDFLDNYSRNINFDLFILVFDLTTFEMQNGSQHIFARHVSRLLTWLQALYEVAPEIPVLLVGTHAEMVKTLSFNDIWTTLKDNSIELGRAHHVKRYADSRINHCLLCAQKDLAVRQTTTKSRSASAGFVDLSFPRADPIMNGHLPAPEEMKQARARLPHVVGYYEVDSKKNFPKDAKKSNISIEQLKSAIVRLTAASPEEGIPPLWMGFLKQILTLTSTLAYPVTTYEEAVNISRRADVPSQQVPYMLQYFHQRGKIIFFDGDNILAKLIVINPAWLILKMRKVLDNFNSSKTTLMDLVEALREPELDKQLQKNSVMSVTSSHWLLAALQRLHLCVPFLDTKDFKLFLLPNLLEVGHPSADVWPDLPEWDEKQITCDYSVRQIKPSLFIDLMLSLNRDGRRMLEIVDDPAPVFLSHHIVFFTGIDIGGCGDCFTARHRVRASQEEGTDVADDDILHKVHIQMHPRMNTIRIAVRGRTPCCTIKSVLGFLELYLDDGPEEDADASSDKTSLSSHALSSGSATSVSHSGHSGASSDQLSVTSSQASEEDDERQFFLLCPKCVLLRHSNPERISYTAMSNKRKAICSKWHNLGSWSRAVTGDYRFNDHHVIPNTMSCALTQLPDYEHPRLVLVLPPSAGVTCKDWYMFNRMKFLEGFEVHFLCEYTGYWHMTDDSGFRLNQSPDFIKRFGNQIQSILQLALPMVQVVNGVPEHGLNGRLLAPVISDLIKTYEYLKHVDTHIADPYTWLVKNKDRVVTMLTKVLANVNDGVPDLYFKVANAINADTVFQTPSTSNRLRLARFLRIESSSGRFGPLRPLYVGREVRWLCDTHYEELRSLPSN